MYLREMGSVELLSREGEIAIAKRIEAGREAMIAGLCESPLTFQAIIIWRDELNDGKVFLRDIIDLEATYAGPDAKNNMAMQNGQAAIGPDGQPMPRPARTPQWHAGAPHLPSCSRRPRRRRAGRSATPFKAARRGLTARSGEGGESRRPRATSTKTTWRTRCRSPRSRPSSSRRCVETFDKIADTFKRLRRLQDQDIQLQLKSDALSPAQERKYKKLKEEIIAEVKSLRLNQARIDALVEQLYDINKRLVGYEGRLMRLSESYGVAARGLPEELPGLRARPALAQPRLEALGQGLEEPRRQGQGQGQGNPRQHPRSSPARPASRSANSARSCRWCRRASARRARPRRRWWRRTCASSSRSPRNTPTAACSSST